MANIYKDIPQASDILSQSQKDIRANFDYLANTLGTSLKSGDHQIAINGVDTTTFEGRHRQISLNNRSGGPPTVAGIGDGTDSLIYSSNGNLFFGTALGAGAFQLTTFNAGANFGLQNIYQVGPPQLSGGWTFLPGGLILQYGKNDVAASINTYTFNFPFAFPNNVFNIQITPFRAASNPGNDNEFWVVSGFTTSQFQIFNKGAHSFQFMWVAIGN